MSWVVESEILSAYSKEKVQRVVCILITMEEANILFRMYEDLE